MISLPIVKEPALIDPKQRGTQVRKVKLRKLKIFLTVIQWKLKKKKKKWNICNKKNNNRK